MPAPIVSTLYFMSVDVESKDPMVTMFAPTRSTEGDGWDCYVTTTLAEHTPDKSLVGGEGLRNFVGSIEPLIQNASSPADAVGQAVTAHLQRVFTSVPALRWLPDIAAIIAAQEGNEQ